MPIFNSLFQTQIIRTQQEIMFVRVRKTVLVTRRIFTNESQWGLHIFVETRSGRREEIVRKTAWQWGPEAVTACLYLAHFTCIGRHRMLQRVSLETGQFLTIFRKRRFLGLGAVCTCVFFVHGQRFRLGNSRPSLVNSLGSLGQASSYTLTPAAAT